MPSRTGPTTRRCSSGTDTGSCRAIPTEGALIVAARKAGLQADHLTRRFARVGEVPFSSERKLMSTLHTDAEAEGRVLLFTKGAPDVLLTRCTHELVGEERRPLSDSRTREILDGERRTRGSGIAHAGRRLPRCR